MRVCLGGTFEPFHAGHEALLRRAAAAAEVLFVGVTAGRLADRPDRTVAPWRDRAAEVTRFLDALGFTGDLETGSLEDPMGPARDGAFDAIVVSPETRRSVAAINAARAAAGLGPLQEVLVPHVLGEDLLPVSGTRVHAGDIDRDGRRLTPVRIAVGSANPVKVTAVQEEMARVLPGLRLDVRGQAVASGVPEQPKQEETDRGAATRARAALAAWPEAEYGIGVEAGLVQDVAEQAWFDVQACVVVDRASMATVGWGPAFQYPEWVTQRALAGEMVSDILGPVAEDPRIGSTTGAIGFLTDGRMDRAQLTGVAVLMAFVPRFHRSLYAVVPATGP